MKKISKPQKRATFSVVIEPEKLILLKKEAKIEGYTVALLVRRILTSWLETKNA